MTIITVGIYLCVMAMMKTTISISIGDGAVLMMVILPLEICIQLGTIASIIMPFLIALRIFQLMFVLRHLVLE